jgi:PiT family inorganic phosphate transporter
MVDLLLILAAVLCFLFGWNNSSFLIGNLRGSGTLTVRASILVSAAGLLLGVLLEGSKMLKSLDGSLAMTPSVFGLEVTFVVTILVTVGLTLMDLPASISAIMVGAFLGVATAEQLHINAGQTFLVVSFWFVAPLATFAVALALHRLFSRLVSNMSLLQVDSVHRLGTIATSLAVAYTLGANNIGLIYGTALGAATAAGGAPSLAIVLTLIAALGAALLGKRNVSGTLGDKMLALSPQSVLAAFFASALLVWGGTQLGVPMSISHCVLGGMLGAAFSSKITVVNRRLTLESISTWVITPVVAFVLALAVMFL